MSTPDPYNNEDFRKRAFSFMCLLLLVALVTFFGCVLDKHFRAQPSQQHEQQKHEQQELLDKGSAGAQSRQDSSLPIHDPDVTVGLFPLSQRDFGLLGATWREMLSFDYQTNGPTLRKKTCASYNRKSADGGFPAQCYMIIYGKQGKGSQVIMPVINPIIALTDITVTPSAQDGERVKAKLVWAKCAFNEVLHDCVLQEPVSLAMSEDYYDRLKRLIVLVRDGRSKMTPVKTPSQGQTDASPPALP